MNADSNIFNSIRQKAEVLSLKFITAYLLATYKQKQLIIFFYKSTYFSSKAIKFLYLAQLVLL